MFGHFVFIFFLQRICFKLFSFSHKYKYCLSASKDLIFLSELAVEVRRERRWGDKRIEK